MKRDFRRTDHTKKSEQFYRQKLPFLIQEIDTIFRVLYRAPDILNSDICAVNNGSDSASNSIP